MHLGTCHQIAAENTGGYARWVPGSDDRNEVQTKISSTRKLTLGTLHTNRLRGVGVGVPWGAKRSIKLLMTIRADRTSKVRQVM